MGFDRSQLLILPYAPFKWTTPPSVNPDGTGVAGVKGQTLDGVFIMLSDELVIWMKQNLTQVQKDEIDNWTNRYTEAQIASWNAPVWAGQNNAVYLRIPAAIWNDPATAPPQKVKDYFRELFK